MKPKLDYLFAVAMLGLAVSAFRSPALGSMGAMLAAVYVVVAASFAARRRGTSEVTARQAIAAFPGVAIGGVAIAAAGPVDTWPFASVLLWVVGAAGMAIALTSMQDAFGVLPQHRRLVTQGAYGLIRHPMYLAQLVMVLGCAVATDPWRGALLWLGAFVVLSVRVEAEEGVLRRDPAWRRYAAAVPYRWIPGVL